MPGSFAVPRRGRRHADEKAAAERASRRRHRNRSLNVATGANRLTLVAMPLDGSTPVRELGTIAAATANGLLEWTPDGKGILFSTVERTNVWLQPLSGEKPARVTDLATLDIVRGRRTPDGSSLIVARGSAQTDAYLVSNFR